ncbi:MAG: hypothetical protein AB1894_28480 [Chloroflexota bacterium]
MNKTAFAISIALTTFVLMMAGGILYAARSANAAPVVQGVPVDDPVEVVTTDPTVEPALQQALEEREAAFQQMISDANARLEAAQKQQLELQAQLDALQAATVTPTTITAEQAAQIAADYLKQNSVYSVEEVTMNGEQLYKVTFSSGDIVYVSMDGEIVGSATSSYGGSTVKTTSSKVGGGGGGGGGGHGDGEHTGGGGGEHDDDDDDD